MRLDWSCLQRVAKCPAWEMGEVLLDYQGPQIALWRAGDHTYLGVAADDDGATVRWLAAPVSPHEIEAIRMGSVELRDIVSQPEVYIFDRDGAGNISHFGALAPKFIPELAMPAHGAHLPDEVTTEYRSRIEIGV